MSDEEIMALYKAEVALGGSADSVILRVVRRAIAIVLMKGLREQLGLKPTPTGLELPKKSG